MPGDPHADFVERVYDAVVEPSRWLGVLESVADLTGGVEANLVAQDEVRCEGAGISVRSDPAALPLYLSRFIKCNPLLKTTDLPLAPRVLTDEQKISKRELVRTDFYNDFFRPFDVHSLLIIRLAQKDTYSAGITVIRPARRELFGRSDIALAEYLHPHLIRAWRLSAEIARRVPWQNGATSLLDDSSVPTFLVGRDNRIRRCNGAADAMLASGPLTARNGVMRAATPELTRRLHGLVAAACVGDPERCRGDIMPLPRDGRPLLIVSVVPVRCGAELFEFETGAERAALIRVQDGRRNEPVPEERLREAFGLTRMEAKVATELLAGHEPRKAAQQLGISYYTLRGHLARMFDKTGVRRQAELVQLLTRSMDPMPQ